jgi:hypothetical protein
MEYSEYFDDIVLVQWNNGCYSPEGIDELEIIS